MNRRFFLGAGGLLLAGAGGSRAAEHGPFAEVDRGELTLDQMIGYGADDLLDYAPVARENLGIGALSVEALCAAAVSLSDNTAANLLLDRIGGPEGLTKFLRE